jgi:hypothetical protein
VVTASAFVVTTIVAIPETPLAVQVKGSGVILRMFDSEYARLPWLAEHTVRDRSGPPPYA